MNTKKLFDLKEQIEEAKSETAELKGQQKHLMKQLQEDWECNTIRQAEQKAEKLSQEIGQLNDKIEQGVEKLEGEYDVG